jgi:hypothetical protein
LICHLLPLDQFTRHPRYVPRRSRVWRLERYACAGGSGLQGHDLICHVTDQSKQKKNLQTGRTPHRMKSTDMHRTSPLHYVVYIHPLRLRSRASFGESSTAMGELVVVTDRGVEESRNMSRERQRLPRRAWYSIGTEQLGVSLLYAEQTRSVCPRAKGCACTKR